MTIEQQKQDYKSKSKFNKALGNEYRVKLEKVKQVKGIGEGSVNKLKTKKAMHWVAAAVGAIGVVAGLVTLSVPVIVVAAGCSMINGAMLYDTHRVQQSIENTVNKYSVAQNELEGYIRFLDSSSDFYNQKIEALQTLEQKGLQAQDEKEYAEMVESVQYKAHLEEVDRVCFGRPISEESQRWIDAAVDFSNNI